MGSSLEAVVGHTSLRGYPDTDPSMTDEVYLADAIVGTNAAFAAASALCRRQVTGKGQLVEVPQAESMAPYFGEALMDCTMNGRVQTTLGNRHPSKAPHGCYPCLGEDRWVVISVGSDAEWEALCRVMGNPTWSVDPRYATCLGRWNNQQGLDRRISEWTRGQDRRQVMGLLQGKWIASGIVMEEEALLKDPHLNHRGFLEELPHADTGTYIYPGLMWKSVAFPNHLRRPACLLGEHNEYVYRELLGVTAEEYREMEALGYIGTEYPPHVK